MKKINYKKLLTMTVFTIINGYSVTSGADDSELLSNERDLRAAETTQPITQETTQRAPIEIQWETTDVLVRALIGQWNATDEWALSVLNMPSLSQNFMEGILEIFLNPTIRPTPITDETSEWFEIARQNINTMKEAEKITNGETIISFGLLPDATVDELFEAGEKILEINPTYVNAAAKCFKAVAEHSDATIEDIINAGQSLIELGEEFQELGTEILLAAANLSAIEPDRIEEIVEEFIILDNTNPQIIASLCHQLFNHPDSSSIYKLHAARYIKDLGSDYYHQASEKLTPLLESCKSNQFIITEIAKIFESMGAGYTKHALCARELALLLSKTAHQGKITTAE